MENRVYLNDDWKFSEQFTEEMLGDGFDVGNMTPVRLPHTVKETPLHYFDESVYQMVSGYRRDVFIPEKWRGKRLLLTIDGAAHESEVYWNGKKIGEHHCGYTAFTMDVSDDAIYGIRNTLVVKVDSRESVNICLLYTSQAGIAYATDQIIDLIANGVNHVHIYTMNKPDVAGEILDNLSEIYVRA